MLSKSNVASVLALVLCVSTACTAAEQPGGGTGGGSADDPGGAGAPDAGSSATAFRIDSVTLLDPHTFAIGAVDVTETVNGMLLDAVRYDGGDTGDGIIDLSIVTVFRPFDPTAAESGIEVAFPDCTAPLAGTTCAVTPSSLVIDATALNSDGPCLEPVAEYLGGFDPPVVAPGGRCFEGGPVSLDLLFGGILLHLDQVRIAARYSGSTQLADGLIVGFMSQEIADATMLPDDLLLVGGQAISALLRPDDMDSGPGGTTGWWFYLGFGASELPWSD